MFKSKAKLQRFLLITLGLLAVILLTIESCANADTNPVPGPSASISICIGGAPGIPVLLAQEQGLFTAAGVAVTLKEFRTATEGFEGFFRGECELAAVSETSVVIKSFDRQDFSILATIATSDNSPRILANRKRGITRTQDLKGKRIFVLNGSSNHYFLDMFLAQNGWSNRDVTVVLTNVPDVTRAFAEGSIDAFCATDVVIDKPLKALGNKAIVFDAPGLSLVSFHLVAINSFIRAKPEVVRKVLAALLNNEMVIKNDRDRAVKIVAATMNIDAQVMAAIWNNYRWRVDLSQVVLLSLEQEAMWMIATGLTSKAQIPNYLDFVYRDALFLLKPDAVTMLK